MSACGTHVAAALDEVWSIARYQLGQPADLLDEDGQPRVVCVYRGFDITRPLMLCLQKNKQLTDEVGPLCETASEGGVVGYLVL